MSHISNITFADKVLSSKSAKGKAKRAAAETAVQSFGTNAGSALPDHTVAEVR